MTSGVSDHAGEASTMNELEQTLAIIARNGLFVNNLFQLGDGWRANLTDRVSVWEFGNGTTMTEALREAFGKVDGPGVKKQMKAMVRSLGELGL